MDPRYGLQTNPGHGPSCPPPCLPQEHLASHRDLLPPELSGLVRLPFQKIGHKGGQKCQPAA